MSPRFVSPAQVRFLVFSATFPQKFFEKIRLNEQPGYAEMKLNPEQLTLKGVKQFVYHCQPQEKPQVVYELFKKCDNQN